jgi:uncharacterized protein (TIGR03000 family)
MIRNTLLLGRVFALGAVLTAGAAIPGRAAQPPSNPGPILYPESGPSGILPAAAPPPAAPRTAPKPADARAHITLKVPEGSEVWFEGTKTTSTGSVRTYRSPPLEPGSKYAYEVRVRWRDRGNEFTQTRQIQIAAGADVVEDFFPAPPQPRNPTSPPAVPANPAPARR